MSDPYVGAAGVLMNVLRITDHERLRQVDADLSFAAMLRLADRPLAGDYDLAHLQAFHHALFAAVYPWAGQLRTIRLARSAHDVFCFPQFIDSTAADVFRNLHRDHHLRGLDRPTFVARLAHYYGEVNAIHPFRDGNGRAQRAFFGQLARAAGWRVNWARIDARTNARASAAALHTDISHLTAMFDDLVTAIAEPLR